MCRARLDRSIWIKNAIDILAAEGVAGLKVEVLAKRLDVTKGSFYWHFRNRHDLLAAVLREWKEGRISDIIKQTRADPDEPLQQVYRVIDIYSKKANRRGMKIELAIRDWARRDTQAAVIVSEVDAARLRYTRDLFLACGVPQQEASSRSMLLYAYVFGISLMEGQRIDSDIARIKHDIADLIARSPNRIPERSP